MARVTHRCSCGKGLRFYIKTRRYGDLYYFLDARTGRPHLLKEGHYVIGVEPKITTLEAYGVEV